MGAAEKKVSEVPGIRQIKILFIMNNLAAFRDRLIFLNSHGIVVKAAADINNALAVIAAEMPDVVFVSWDLKKANVKKFYELLTKTHGFLCVIVAEDRSPLRVSALMNSGIPSLILPPVSGQTILERTQTLVRDRDNFLKTFHRAGSQEIEPEGSWQLFNGKKGQNPMWRFHADSPTAKDEYFAQASAKPEYDWSAKKWKNINEDAVFKRPKSEEPEGMADLKALENSVSLMSEVSMQKAIERANQDPDEAGKQLAKAEMAKALESNAIPSQTVISEKSKDPSSIMAKSVEVAVELSVERTAEVTKPIENVSKGTVTLVKTGNFKGYLMGANASNTSDEELAAKVRGHLATVLNNHGEQVGGDVTIQTLELDQVPFLLWAEQNSEFIVNSQHGMDEVAFAYFASSTIMERPDGQTDVFSIDIEKCLAADKEITFGVYLHLPKNKKFVQYIHQATVFTQVMKDKLLKQGIKEVFIKNTDSELYELYCAKNDITQSIAKFKAAQKKS